MRMAYVWAIFSKIARNNPIHSVTNFGESGFLGSFISLRILFTSDALPTCITFESSTENKLEMYTTINVDSCQLEASAS